MPTARIGVIGGSGLYEMEGLSDIQEVRLDTPFGPPSDAVTIGSLEGERVAFLPRHGRGHRLAPSELPSRANIYALKSLGVEHIISVSACGSMREDIAPLDVVIPDQVFDRTKGIRPATFFGDGLVVHISFADPFCPELSGVLHQAAQTVGAHVHRGGTLVVMEGPQFSTRAESRIYRQWGVDIIGMTALPEAKLAREAEICYATLAMVTDYDVWHTTEEPVTAEMVVRNLQKNVQTAQRIIRAAIGRIGAARPCPCALALQDALITQKPAIPAARRERLDLIIGKYLR
ncbi:MAG TPA: S-methyl-5'-thioadenosine phosphorylase [Anaerolineae bacterium]|nr:S-methyl-5'-thioadenosine phosphorylase [Anaerolineae bacterium]HPL27098.1 S-methyl-5'-thioadenosine phosphorylase [Anaerolineae bacterium]